MRHFQRFRNLGLALALDVFIVFLLAACQAVGDGAEVATGGDAAAYCEEQGGRVIIRSPVYGTNLAEENQLTLREPRQFCNFESPVNEDSPDDFRSQIEIDLLSLYSERPTLALLAYLEASQPDLGNQPASANPSIIHCTQLGGSAVFGPADSINGGGWVKASGDSTNAFDVQSLCVFPDGSAIDTWGITYHSDGTIRGIALDTVVRYRPDGSYPPIFGPSR